MGLSNFAATVMMSDMMGSISERRVHMQFIFAGLSILVFFVTTMNLGSLDLGGWLKAAIVIPLVFLVVYSMARIMPKELRSEKETKK
jgi:ABC-type phosphate transport system permease subunit